MAAPSMTYGAEGNVRSATSLAASASSSNDLDYSAKIGAWVVVKNTPGGSVSSTRGVAVNFYPRYGTTPSTATITAFAFTLPSAAASTAESKAVFLGTGKWRVTTVNLDAGQAVSIEITDATVDSIG